MGFNEDLDPKGKKGKRLTILSIDGGGVRGIIPAKILKVLEDEIKVNFFGAHPAQKCRFFTHPTHPKNCQFQYVASALTSGFSSVTSILLHRAPFSCTSIAKSLKIVKL
jgi:hypothetical protein